MKQLLFLQNLVMGGQTFYQKTIKILWITCFLLAGNFQARADAPSTTVQPSVLPKVHKRKLTKAQRKRRRLQRKRYRLTKRWLKRYKKRKPKGKGEPFFVFRFFQWLFKKTKQLVMLLVGIVLVPASVLIKLG